MSDLDHYRRKRNFRRTPEPAGRAPVAEGPEGLLFVVHKHAARRPHYDLRLEHEGVLESWAVPKGPSLEPGEKRLAVKVEDHPLEYGDFEGVIPRGEYGAGTVMLWDRGRCQVQRREPDRIDFTLEGEKLHGAWSLVRMHGRDADDGRNWLLIRRRHQPDGSGSAAPRVPMNASVASGRTMQQITAGKDPVTTADENEGFPETPDPASLEHARKRPLPDEPRPQLATLAAEPPTGDDWFHEIKFDGYRLMARCAKGRVRLVSRNGQDWSARFPQIASQLQGLPVDQALLDGEVVAMRKDGSRSFSDLQKALSTGRTGPLV